jgi:hypothetical protein
LTTVSTTSPITSQMPMFLSRLFKQSSLRTRQANGMAWDPMPTGQQMQAAKSWILTLTRLQAGFDTKIEA